MSTQIAAEPLRRGSIFSYGGRTYQVRRIDPGWGEHGQLVADDLSIMGIPIARIFDLDTFTQRTGYLISTGV
ncbi:MAG TPA: hypothetical protein PLD43_04515 [Anaerolineae bacterium]|nr:hypothetical protein [Anaerolineae bacterium]